MRCVIVPSVSHFRRAIRDKSVVVRCRQGVVDVYPAPEISNPNTADQQASRSAWSLGCAAWRERTSAEKGAWSAYAQEFERRFERQTAEPLTGYRLFQSSAKFRQILGLPIRTEAPRTAPPEGVLRVELLPCPDAGTIRLRLHHGHATGRGLRVLVSQSPGKQASRKPQRREARHIRGWGTASTAPLPATGGEVEFRDVRFPVQPGQRFGVWVRIVRESDGLASNEFFADLTQREFLVDSPSATTSTPPPSPRPRPTLPPATLQPPTSLRNFRPASRMPNFHTQDTEHLQKEAVRSSSEKKISALRGPRAGMRPAGDHHQSFASHALKSQVLVGLRAAEKVPRKALMSELHPIIRYNPVYIPVC